MIFSLKGSIFATLFSIHFMRLEKFIDHCIVSWDYIRPYKQRVFLLFLLKLFKIKEDVSYARDAENIKNYLYDKRKKAI